jgi:hypothetical protein
MVCHCSDVAELSGEEAKTYADEHLERVEVRADGWELVYRCPDTGREWIRDYPRSEEHGGGPVRLRRT